MFLQLRLDKPRGTQRAKMNLSTVDFSSFPTLTTSRLILREVVLSDAPDIFIFRKDYEVQKYNAPIAQTLEEVEASIKDIQVNFLAQKALVWSVMLRESNHVIGQVGLHHWNRYHRRAEVGYDFALAYWGQGLGTEAVGAITTFGFEQMNLHRIEASTIADNYGSVRLLGKVGFKLEGTRRQSSLEDDGRFHDSAIYGLLKNESL